MIWGSSKVQLSTRYSKNVTKTWAWRFTKTS